MIKSGKGGSQDYQADLEPAEAEEPSGVGPKKRLVPGECTIKLYGFLFYGKGEKFRSAVQ